MIFKSSNEVATDFGNTNS